MSAVPSPEPAAAPEPAATPGSAEIALGGVALSLRSSGAVWAPAASALIVADLHLGRSERMARLGGPLLPPYETAETLDRLADEIARLSPRLVVSLGDAFDDARAAAELEPAAAERLLTLAAGRRWVWIAGNHDPTPVGLTGESRAELSIGRLTLRHEARRGVDGLELSGHLHPKATLVARGRRMARRCFLVDRRRLILPAFGLYTGGLDARDVAFDALLEPEANAWLCAGAAVLGVPRAALAMR